MYEIAYAEGVYDDLKNLSAHERSTILDKMEEQLRLEPNKETRNKKLMRGLKPPFEHEPPVWELRVGEFRLFYDIDEAERRVIVRAIRHKPPHKTTEEIL